MRPSRRQNDELRAVSLERGVVKYAEGSCFVRFGDTHVLVTATLEDRLPPWLKGQGRGWVTAEYGMLPRATLERTRREASAGKQTGRTVEIQRLIGRSLRTVVDLTALGERQITVDCDVVQADGGTRTAAITGAWVALYDCIGWMKKREMIKTDPLRDHVAAISCGICAGTPVLDLDYAEDSQADTDANFVMTGAGLIVEVQGTAEKVPFSEEQLLGLLGAGPQGHQQAGRSAEDGGDVSVPTAARAAAPARAHRRIAGELVIATHNPGKLAELRELLAPFGIKAASAGELGLAEPEETGTTFRENARIKAAAAAAAAQRPAFADDSGLVVEALAARRGFIRRAGPASIRISPPPCAGSRTSSRRAAPCGRKTARRISCARCAWPGRTSTWKSSRAASTARWCGRRAAPPASAMTRFSARWPRPHLRRDDQRREARPAAARHRPLAPGARVPTARGGLPCTAMTR